MCSTCVATLTAYISGQSRKNTLYKQGEMAEYSEDHSRRWSWCMLSKSLKLSRETWKRNFLLFQKSECQILSQSNFTCGMSNA